MTHPPAADDVWTLAAEKLRLGELFCLATVVRAASPEVPAGTKGLFTEAGLVAGSEVLRADPGLARHADTALSRRHSARVEGADGSQVFLDVMGAQPRLLICGAGHIAIPLARLTLALGFEVTVLDDRPDFARPERFPGATVRAEEFTPALAAMDLGPEPYVVIITRGHEHDTECLAVVLNKPTRYVGMIGSKRRVRFVLETLAREGCAAERLEQVFSPIGLPIGAETPEEIALTIAAELVCVRRKGPQQARTLRAAVTPPGRTPA
ncbi:MAG TPA: XdhC family protein [Deferrisomatales bacterium]|nr:XdhC family protein [Deferrisomatales bacterium]